MRLSLFALLSMFVITLVAGCSPGVHSINRTGDVPIVKGDPKNDNGGFNIDSTGGEDIVSGDSVVGGGDPFDEANGATRMHANVIYFSYDNASVPESEYSKVNEIINIMKNDPSRRVLIEGHCDNRGSDEYNRSLGNRRANSVLEYIESAGIAADRITAISKGEEIPAVKDAKSESDHAKNRRGEFVFAK